MFNRETLAPIETGGENSIWAYKTDDTSLTIIAGGYFNDAADVLEEGSGILIISKFGTFMAYISAIDDGYVKTQVSSTPMLEGDIEGQNTITVTEITAILESYGILEALDQNISILFHDPTDNPDRAFMCTYTAESDTWYFEKLDPCPV